MTPKQKQIVIRLSEKIEKNQTYASSIGVEAIKKQSDSVKEKNVNEQLRCN